MMVNNSTNKTNNHQSPHYKSLRHNNICCYVWCFVWWCLTPFSAIVQLYRGGQFCRWRKPEDPEKTYMLCFSSLNFLSYLSHLMSGRLTALGESWKTMPYLYSFFTYLLLFFVKRNLLKLEVMSDPFKYF